MKFSILIPTYKNINYLKLTIRSLKKNSKYKHEIIVHNNSNDLKTSLFLKKERIKFTSSNDNLGLCSAVNKSFKISKNKFIVYAHDDMYFLPNWDQSLINNIKKIGHIKFYLSSTQLCPNKPVKGNIQHIECNYGKTINEFDEKKILKKFNDYEFRDLQGSHWAPHIVHRKLWKKIGGFSEEFNPGFASDPDVAMKLWKVGVRIFKGVSDSRVYHFGSLTTRKNKRIKRNNGKKTFLLKWKMTTDFFCKYYLNRGGVYDAPLTEPKISLVFILGYMQSYVKYIITILFNNDR